MTVIQVISRKLESCLDISRHFLDNLWKMSRESPDIFWKTTGKKLENVR